MKICNICKQEKPLTEYNSRQAKCRSCQKQCDKQYRLTNLEYQKQWRLSNIEHIKKYIKQWYSTNPEYQKQYHKSKQIS